MLQNCTSSNSLPALAGRRFDSADSASPPIEHAFAVTVDLRIGAGWHINAVRCAGGGDSDTRRAYAAPGHRHGRRVEVAGAVCRRARRGPVYRGEITLHRTLKVAEKATVGSVEVVCSLAYQACDEKQCLRPTTIKLKAPLEVVSP